MTVSQWLSARRPLAPPALASRVEQALSPHLNQKASVAATCCMDAAEQLLVELLARAHAGRECAIDLLTVDALVTYALEAATDDPATLDDRAHRAMSEIARLGSASPTA